MRKFQVVVGAWFASSKNSIPRVQISLSRKALPLTVHFPRCLTTLEYSSTRQDATEPATALCATLVDIAAFHQIVLLVKYDDELRVVRKGEAPHMSNSTVTAPANL